MFIERNIATQESGGEQMKNVFVVTADGYSLNCGAEIYLIGVFDNYEDARTASLHCSGVSASITIIELNQAFPLKRADEISRYSKSNDYFLGGYCE